MRSKSTKRLLAEAIGFSLLWQISEARYRKRQAAKKLTPKPNSLRLSDETVLIELRELSATGRVIDTAIYPVPGRAVHLG